MHVNRVGPGMQFDCNEHRVVDVFVCFLFSDNAEPAVEGEAQVPKKKKKKKKDKTKKKSKSQGPTVFLFFFFCSRRSVCFSQ